MIPSKYVAPRIFPWNNDRDPEQIDRTTTLGWNLVLNREPQYENGREGVLGYKKNRPAMTFTMEQYEYGQMATWRDFANVEDPASDGLTNSIELKQLTSPFVDIAAFLTDDDDTFRGTIHLPKLRVKGFTLNIGNPEDIIMRSFNVVGEDKKIIDGNYLAWAKKTAASATETMVLNPVAIAYASGKYIFKVLRVRSGVVTELTEGTSTNQWSYVNGTATLTIRNCVASDIIKVFYPSATAYTTTWTDNNTDVDFLTAECAEIYIKVGVNSRVYRLQTVGIDVSLDRTDYGEIGNSEIVQTGVKSKAVTISLDRYAEDFALEDIMAGDTTYPYVDPRDFVENIQVMVKIFSDKTHTTFKIGYLMNNISPSELDDTQAVQDYHKRSTKLVCDNLKISDDESEIVFA